jgi:hypothetical protein
MDRSSATRRLRLFVEVALCLAGLDQRLSAQTDRYLLEVPDYNWYAGCFGTATGNLMGYWDRHGLSGFYTGAVNHGVAPLDSSDRGTITNSPIRLLFASKGHMEDYWSYYRSDFDFSYQSTATDPYLTAGRAEHTPDCVGDFIGLSQRKWTNMNNECDGNVDAYSFVYWDSTGNRRTNFVPSGAAGTPARDIQSGLREWTRWRGYDADVFTQLTDFNPNVPNGHGFTFNDLKAEIDAGYPVLLFLQSHSQFSRPIAPMTRANPEIHGMMAYGYYIGDEGNYVHYRTSWGDASSANLILSEWNGQSWQAGLPVRGVIGYHPKPKITSVTWSNATVTVSWEGPSSLLHDSINQTTTPVSRYVLERAPALGQPYVAVTQPTTDHTATITDCCGEIAFFRVGVVVP